MRRRTVLATLGGGLTGGTAGCFGSLPSGSSNRPDATASEGDSIPSGTWPQLAYDARNTRHARHARGPREGATVAWTAFGDHPVYPPVVDDAVYLTDAWAGGTAFAVAPESGSVQWTNSDLPPMRWAPALHEERLLVVTRDPGNVVRLHALDTGAGEEAWVREEGITASSGSRPPTGPTVRGGTVYLGSNRGVVAVDATTGDVEWHATLGPHVVETKHGPTWRTDWAMPAVTADRVFTFDTNESYQKTREVYAVDRATGNQAWTATLELADGWTLQGHAVAGDDYVFVFALDARVRFGAEDSEWTGTQRLFALDAASGDVAWQWQPERKSLTPPAYADGTLYVGEWYPDEDTGRLHALDATTGRVAWTSKTEVGGVRSPTVAGDTVYLAQGTELAAVATADGSQRWRLDVGARAGSPVVVGDTVYLQTDPGRDSDSRLLAIREP